VALLDDFNRANGALGSNWANVGGLAGSDYVVASNKAKASGGNGASAWNASSFSSDQEVQVTLGALDTTAQLWLLLMVANPAAGSFTGYLLVMQQHSTTYDLTLYRGNAGSYTTIVSTVSGISYSGTGDVFVLRKVGSALTVLQNGAPVSGFNAVTDSSPLTGSAYIGIGYSGSNVLSVDDFGGGATSTTYTGEASVSLTDTITTSGVRVVHGSSSLSASVSITTTGSRATYGASVVSLHVGVVTHPHLSTTGSASVDLHVTVFTHPKPPVYTLAPSEDDFFDLAPGDESAFSLVPLYD
jgi:hypothetical protein